MDPRVEIARATIERNAARRVRAPELPASAPWCGVRRPLAFDTDLEGHVTLFHFFTPSRAACWPTLEIVAFVERKYRDSGLAILGVLAPRLPHEATLEGARAASLRFGVEHAVVVDVDGSLQRGFAVAELPTLALVSAEGVVLASFSGSREDRSLRAAIDAACEAALEFEREHGRLAPRDLPLRRERFRQLPRELSYPARVAVDPVSRRVFLSDANHDRVLELKDDGAFVRAFGSGTPGFRDGTGTEARFFRPQGLAIANATLFVADAGNHAIRRVDLGTGEVTTIAGTGTRGFARLASNDPRSVALDSPLDVVIDPGSGMLLVALAGSNSIARLDPAGALFEPFAGDGAALRRDGPTTHASFAQPSGLALADGTLFVAESGSSSIRAIDLGARTVRTIAGGSPEPRDLDWAGDHDGRGFGRRFRLPLAIAVHGAALIVADAGANRIRRVDPANGEVTTLTGLGLVGHEDGPDEDARFFEPSGVAAGGSRIWIADSANHALRFLDLGAGAVGTLSLRDVPIPRPRIAARARSDELPDVPPALPGTVFHPRLDHVVTPGVVTIEISLEPPPGFEFAGEGPSQFHVRRSRGAIDIEHAKGKIRRGNFAIQLHVDGPGAVEIVCAWYFCAGENCRLRVARFPLSFVVAHDGTDHVRLRDVIHGAGVLIPPSTSPSRS